MPSNNHVFFSYSAADADQAQRLAEALERRGYATQCKSGYTVEIKDFIEASLLFIPVISKNAESNKLGAFRIAWKVAAKKIEKLEAAATFILPVVVDDTKNYNEIVPKTFRTLPWLRENSEAVSDEFIDTAIQMIGAQAKDVEFPPIAGGQSLPPFAFGQSEPAPAPTPAPAAATAKAPTHNLVAKPSAKPEAATAKAPAHNLAAKPAAETIAKPVTKPVAQKFKLPRQWVLGAAGLVVLAGGAIWWSQREGPADPEVAETPVVATAPETTIPETPTDTFDPTAYSDEQLWADYEAHRKARRYPQAAERLEPLTTRNTDLSTARSLELARTRFAHELDPDAYLAAVRTIVETSPEIQLLPPSVLGMTRNFAGQRQAIRAGEGDLHSLLEAGPLPREVALTDSYLDQGNRLMAQHFAGTAQRDLTPKFAEAGESERLLQNLEIFILMANQDPEAIARLEQITDRTEAEDTMLIRALVYQGHYDRALGLIGTVLSRPGLFDVAEVLYSPPLEKLHSHPEFKTALAPFAPADKIEAAIAWVAARTQP